MVPERYDVYRKALMATREAAQLARGFPVGSGWLSDQLRRAVAAVPLHVAEGLGRRSRPDRERFFVIGRASVAEAAAALDVAVALGLVPESQTQTLRNLLIDCAKMLARLSPGR